jgi:hypothetical protein
MKCKACKGKAYSEGNTCKGNVCKVKTHKAIASKGFQGQGT